MCYDSWDKFQGSALGKCIFVPLAVITMLDLPSDLYYVATQDFSDEALLMWCAIAIIIFNILLAIIIAKVMLTGNGANSFIEEFMSNLTRYKEFLTAIDPNYDDKIFVK